MLQAIGRKPRDGGDVVDLLLECHGRIRTFGTLAVTVGERTDTPLLEVVDACARVERYFTEALPLHVRDEEDSVLPRLLGRSPDLDRALARMREEHAQHEDLLGSLLAASALLRRSPDDTPSRAGLLAAARALRAAFEPHLETEERVVFPALRALVPAAEQIGIVAELRARRAGLERSAPA